MRGHVRVFSCLLVLTGCTSAQSVGSSAADSEAGGPQGPIDSDTSQLVTVVSKSWTDFRADLRRFRRTDDGSWVQVGDAIDVVLGHAGYGWGHGLHGTGAPPGRGGPVKREGDGRSPAGAFELGPMYGYDPDVGRVALTYVAATPALRCVDDPQSTHYNRIVSTSSVTPDWGSAERMLRSDDLYELAILVSHNQGQPKPGAGSCIFLHVWGGPDVPVRGCTAMAKPALERLSRWLEPTAVLVALPEGEYGALSGRWELPP